MANRVLRDWTTSESMDALSSDAEVFFTRLIMKADDYGSFYANPKLIEAALFPLRSYTPDQIKGWIKECITAGLIFCYTVEGKDYIRIKNFGQRLRNMRNCFPDPVDNSQQLAANGGDSRPETKRNEVETKLCAAVCEIFGRKYEAPADRLPGLANWFKTIEDQCDKIMKVYPEGEESIKQVKAYLKHCRDTKRIMVGTDFKVAETILSADWVKLITPMGGTGSGINVGQNRKVHAG